MRHQMAPPQGACGRGCAPVPNSVGGRGLFERSEFRSPNSRDRGKGTRRATPGRPWFWVLLPKQKDLGVRGRNPAKPPPRCAGPKPRKTLPSRRAGPKPRILHVPFLSSSTIVIENPVSVALRTKEKEKALDPRSGSGMTDKRRKTAREGADVGQKARTEVRRPARRPVVTTA